MPERQTKKRHHYLPQSYLKNFTNENDRIFVYDSKENSINEQSKYGTFWEKKHYTMDTDKYEKRSPEDYLRILKQQGLEGVDTSEVEEYPDMVEDLLGEIESNTALITEKLMNSQEITSEERDRKSVV